MDVETRAVVRLELCAVVLFSLLLGGSARPSSWNYRRAHRALPEREIRITREPLDRSRPDLPNIGQQLSELTSSIAEVVQDVKTLKSDLVHELQTVKREINSATVPQMKCRTAFTRWFETIGRTLEYLDNFDIHCRHGEFLRQWRMTWGEQGNKKALRYVCCHLTHEHHHSHERGHDQIAGATD